MVWITIYIDIQLVQISLSSRRKRERPFWTNIQLFGAASCFSYICTKMLTTPKIEWKRVRFTLKLKYTQTKKHTEAHKRPTRHTVALITEKSRRLVLVQTPESGAEKSRLYSPACRTWLLRNTALSRSASAVRVGPYSGRGPPGGDGIREWLDIATTADEFSKCSGQDYLRPAAPNKVGTFPTLLL